MIEILWLNHKYGLRLNHFNPLKDYPSIIDKDFIFEIIPFDKYFLDIPIHFKNDRDIIMKQITHHEYIEKVPKKYNNERINIIGCFKVSLYYQIYG